MRVPNLARRSKDKSKINEAKLELQNDKIRETYTSHVTSTIQSQFILLHQLVVKLWLMDYFKELLNRDGDVDVLINNHLCFMKFVWYLLNAQRNLIGFEFSINIYFTNGTVDFSIELSLLIISSKNPMDCLLIHLKSGKISYCIHIICIWYASQ